MREEKLNDGDATHKKQRAKKGEALVKEWSEKKIVAGYVARFGDEVAPGVVLTKGDTIDQEVPIWLRRLVSYDEVGILFTVDVTGRERVDGMVEIMHLNDRLIEANTGLTQPEIDHLLDLVRKEKFAIDESGPMGFVRGIRDKLQGFAELPLFDEGVPEPGTVGAVDQPLVT
jgi:hypothetical protein